MIAATVCALLFALVGTVIYTRTKTRLLDELHGLIDRMPGIAWLFVAAGLASMGLPGFSGFISELYVVLGAWHTLPTWVLIGAGLGIFSTFAYTLQKIHEAFFRKRPEAPADAEPYTPMTVPEKIGCALLLGTSLVIGLYPRLLTEKMVPSLQKITQLFAQN